MSYKHISESREVLQPSLNGRAQESGYEISGVIWVKFPAGTRGTTMKAWTRKFVSIRSEFVLQPECRPVLCGILLIHRSEKSDSEITLKKRLNSSNTLIFRSK
jgi:hypothetical protein